MLEGIVPILFTPFDENGDIDAQSLRNIVRFEVDGGVHAIGINGFASEAYKMTDGERLENVEIVAGELAGALPLVIGIAPTSLEAAVKQARQLAPYRPAALMTLPPATMDNGPRALVDFYIDFGRVSEAPIILQQAPHIPMYRHTELAAEALAEIADRAPACEILQARRTRLGGKDESACALCSQKTGGCLAAAAASARSPNCAAARAA